MSRSVASGWIGRLSLKPSRCVCWGVGSKRLDAAFRITIFEKYLAEKELNVTATLDAKNVYADADFVVIAAPTNVYSTKSVEF